MSFTVMTMDDQPLFRVSSLEYHTTGLSYVGARKVAGRFNRHNQSALYLALEPETGLAEYWGGAAYRPAVVLPVSVTSDRLLDLRADLSALPDYYRGWDCNWKDARERYVMGDVSADCSSWQCSDDAIKRGFSGIVYWSTKRSGGSNLALFPENAVFGTSTVRSLDPHNEVSKSSPLNLTL